ncbi:MAG: chaperone NapD [Deltaproteobacteria bacterium]|nr:chaperone NapD [Deltaproteobacteria bacterium]
MHVSGILVVTEPQEMEVCARELEALPGLEVHYQYPDLGRLVVVQETETVQEQEDGLRRIQSLPSVVMAALVEHRIDS